MLVQFVCNQLPFAYVMTFTRTCFCEFDEFPINPRPSKGGGGVVATSCDFFFQTNFLGNRKFQMAISMISSVIYINPIMHLFTKINRNLGVPYAWVAGVVKVVGREEVGETP